jgi:DNA-directed RNA polymerase
MLTLNACATEGLEFACVHDSFGTWACDTTLLSRILRQEFVKMYESKPLLQLAEVMQTQVPEDMIIGDLDLQHCRSSIYFFC